MTIPRSYRLAALGVSIAALAIGMLAVHLRRGGSAQRTAERPLAAAAKVPAGSPRALRLESLDGAPDAPLRRSPAPRKIAETMPVAAAPAAIRKEALPLADDGISRQALSPDERGRGKKPGDYALGRDEVVKERNGVYGFGNEAYGTSIGKGRVDFARTISVKDVGQPSLSFQLDEVKAGGAVLARGGDAATRASLEDRTLSFDRGAVEERYLLRPDALEQSFVVRSVPSGGSDLTVTGWVSSNLAPPADGTAGPKLAWTVQGHEVLTLSDAVAVDAAGRRQELSLAYAGGKVSITVPASWMAGAIFPVTIDPLMGGPVTVDPSVSATVAQVNGVPVRVTDVAYNALQNEWLVVWQEQFGASAFNFDVYAQRVSASGNLVGGPIAVAVTGAGEYEPAVSWAPLSNRYLVAWRQDPADDGSALDQFIAGRVLNADGTFLTPAFVLDDVAGQDFGPSLAFDGTNWFCVFTNVASATATNVIGRFVATDGTPGTAVVLESDSDLAAAPAVDVVGGTYLVAWQKGPSGGPMSVVGRTMSTSGALLTAITAIDTSTADCSAPDVAGDGTQFLVVWQQTASATDRNVVGRRVATSGTPSGNAINIRTSTADQLTPRAKWSSTNAWWYVVYSDTTNGDADIYGNRVDATGKVYAANRITSVAVDEVRPALAWNSATDEMLVCYLFGASSPYQIKAERVSMDFTAPSIPGAPVATPNPSPTGSFALAWSATTETGGSGFSNYDLQRSCNGGSTWATIASPTTESYTDTMPFGEYVYRVRASDVAGNNSAYSPASAVVTVQNLPPPEALALAQFKLDGVTSITSGGATPDSGVVLQTVVNSLGLLDGFEDGNFTIDPMWTVGTGGWGISTDGYKVLHDGSGLDDQIYTSSSQTLGSWEWRFRFATIATGSTVNLQTGFFPFLDSLGVGGNGYQVLVTAGAASSKSVSFYRMDGANAVLLAGTNNNWIPDTSFHVIRLNRAPSGRWDLLLDGAPVGSATDLTYSVAASTVIHRLTTNGNTLHVDYLRSNSSATARPLVKLQVEVKPFGTPFDGTGLLESAPVAGGSTVSLQVPSLAVGGYVWRARVADTLGNASAFTAFGTGATPDFSRIPATPPPPPSSLVATSGNAQVGLSWGASSGATSYTVKRSATHGTGYVAIGGTMTALSFTDSTAQNLTTYYYIVTATGAGGESAPSGEAIATPQGIPAAPTSLLAIGGNNQVSLSWTAPPGTVTYIVQRSGQSGGPYTTLASQVVPTAYIDSTAVNGSTYFYVVSAQDSAGTSPLSSEASATPAGPPPAPATFTGVALTSGSIRWNWSDVPGETGFRLRDDGNALLQTLGAGVTTATETGLSENAAYTRHVDSVYGAFESGPSPSKSLSTLVHDARPGDFILTRAAVAEVDITVVPPPNAARGNTGVQIERSSNGGAWLVIKPFSRVYSLQDLGLSPTASYSYQIRFQNADGVPSQVSPPALAPSAQAPPAPALTVTPVLTTMLQLNWNNVPDVTGYTIQDQTGASQGTTAPFVTSWTKTGLLENSAHTYQVVAQGVAGPSAPSNAVTSYTGIHTPAPGDLSAVLSGPTQVTVTVAPPPNPTADLTGCEIQRQIGTGPWATIQPFSGVYVLSDSNVPANTSVQYRFRYQNGSGLATSYSPTFFLSTSSSSIGAPGGFLGVPQSIGSILWTWGEVSGETGFILTSDTGVVATLGPGVLSYLEQNLAQNTQYSRQVLAQQGSALGPSSGRLSAYTLVRDAGGADFTATTASMSSVSLTFGEPVNAQAGSTGVFLERSLDGISWVPVSTLSGSYAFVDAGLLGSTTYQYRFRYLNGDGVSSGVSPTKTASTPPATVSPVTGLTAALQSPGIVLQWNANTDPALAGYSVYRSTKSGGPYARINSTVLSGTSFGDSGVAPQTTYFYVVRAQATSGGEGANSNEATATTLAKPPTVHIFNTFGISSTSIGTQFATNFFGLYSFQAIDDAGNVTGTLGPIFTDPESPPTIVETGLAENTSYSRRIVTLQNGLASDPSQTRAGYTLVHNALATDFTVSWVSSSNSVAISVVPPPSPTAENTGVVILRFNGSYFSTLVTLTGTYTYTDLGLSPGTTYQYEIQYLNGDGFPSSASPPQSVSSPSGVVALFSGVAQSASSVLWSWSLAANVSGYQLQDTQGNVIATVDASTLTYLESGLQENSSTSRQVVGLLLDGTPASPSPVATVSTLVHDPQPSDFTVGVLPSSNITVTVTPPPGAALGATGCEIQRLVGTTWTVAQPFSSNYSFVDMGLVQSTTYSYRIRFRNADGVVTNPSPSQSAMTGPPPAPAPTGLAGVAQSSGSILWSWDNFVGADSYVLLDPAENVVATVAQGVLSFTETSLGENAPAPRHLRALVGGWLSAPSPVVTRYTLVHNALAQDLSVTALSSTVVGLSAMSPPQATSGQTGCLFERSPDGLSWTTVQGFSSTYSAQDTSLAKSTSYSYRLSFRNGDGVVGLPSPAVPTQTLAIMAPTITTPSKKTRNPTTSIAGTSDPGVTITVYFNAVADGTTSADQTGAWVYVSAPKSDGVYTVTARASQGTQQTGDSNAVQITISRTRPAPPGAVRLAPYNNIIDVEWDPSASANVAGYLVYRLASGSNTWTLLNPGQVVLGTKYRDSSVVNGTQYSYKVVAVDDAGNQ